MRAEMGKDPSRVPSSQLNLPPGFRFYPTDEELCVHYLCKKAACEPFDIPIIAEVELYKFDPWDLPQQALFGEKEWYFFSPRDRKYPNGSRPNRAAGSGYWKATGTDKAIHAMGGMRKVGVKKALVFYRGKAPKGEKTNWIMHEYRLADSAARSAKKKGTLRLDDWVLCRIYKKCSSAAQKPWGDAKEQSESSCLDNAASPTPLSGGDERLLSNQYRYQDLGAHDVNDDKRTVSLRELYSSDRAQPCAAAAFPSSNPYTQQQFEDRILSSFAGLAGGVAHLHPRGAWIKAERDLASSGDMSNADSPSNVLSSRHTSEMSVGEEDAAESNFVSFPSYSADQISSFPHSVYGTDTGMLLPSPTGAMAGTQSFFSSMLELDPGNVFGSLGSGDYNVSMRPFCKPPHQMSLDANISSYSN
ncbi:hypothetical protein KP509_10G022600 [Ceratopteris richardii]|uniref:NAC domain-containing protein n=1 Tax=Ceratopteris richardii TaxID=49495 RepID=A0A8T2TZV2_CERRI|nr:hypothetical protein KP509_10G022600 [Ceratopteris richardii]